MFLCVTDRILPLTQILAWKGSHSRHTMRMWGTRVGQAAQTTRFCFPGPAQTPSPSPNLPPRPQSAHGLHLGCSLPCTVLTINMFIPATGDYRHYQAPPTHRLVSDKPQPGLRNLPKQYLLSQILLIYIGRAASASDEG